MRMGRLTSYKRVPARFTNRFTVTMKLKLQEIHRARGRRPGHRASMYIDGDSQSSEKTVVIEVRQLVSNRTVPGSRKEEGPELSPSSSTMRFFKRHHSRDKRRWPELLEKFSASNEKVCDLSGLRRIDREGGRRR